MKDKKGWIDHLYYRLGKQQDLYFNIHVQGEQPTKWRHYLDIQGSEWWIERINHRTPIHSEIFLDFDGDDASQRYTQTLRNIDKIKDGSWYSLNTRLQFLRSAVEVFNMTDGDIQDLGRSGASLSTISSLYLKLIVNPKIIFDLGPKVWSQNYDDGRLEAEYNGPKGSYFRIHDFQGDPLLCKYLIGYWKEVFHVARVDNRGGCR